MPRMLDKEFPFQNLNLKSGVVFVPYGHQILDFLRSRCEEQNLATEGTWNQDVFGGSQSSLDWAHNRNPRTDPRFYKNILEVLERLQIHGRKGRRLHSVGVSVC